MVAGGALSYGQDMAPKTLCLAHPEFCAGCAALLPTGTAVLVDGSCHVSCAGCAGDLTGLAAMDPWSPIDDPALRDLLRRRHDADRRTLVSA